MISEIKLKRLWIVAMDIKGKGHRNREKLWIEFQIDYKPK